MSQWVGLWWLPATPDRRIGGTLSVDSDKGITLELIGSFEDGFAQEVSEYPIIQGVIPGSLITLTNCISAGTSSSYPGYRAQRIFARTGYKGAHFPAQEEARFNQMYVSYSHMPEWLGISGFDVQWELAESPDRSGYIVRYVVPSDNFQVENDEFILTLSFSYSLEPGNTLRHVSLSQNVSFRIQSNEELTPEDWQRRFIYPLQNFLTLATNKPNFPVHLAFFSPRLTIGTHQELLQPIEELLEPIDSSERPLHQPDMLFSYAAIEANIQTMMSRWLDIAQVLDSVCYLFFDSQYSSTLHLEQTFLNLAQAAESFHRRRRNNARWPRDEFHHRRDTVLAQVSEEYNDWLRQLLMFANEPTFAKRMEELVVEIEPVVQPLINDRESFIKLVKNTRNYYVHWSEDLRNRAATGERLFRVVQILKFMLQTLLLMEMGLPSLHAMELVMQSRHYQYAIQSGPLA